MNYALSNILALSSKILISHILSPSKINVVHNIPKFDL